MAYVRLISSTTTSLTVDIDGLSLPQNQYGQFRFRIDYGSWTYVNVDPYYTGYDSGNASFGGLSPGNWYYIEAEAYTNAWYSAGSSTEWTEEETAPSDTTSPSLGFDTPSGSNVTSSSIYAYAYASDNVALSYFQFFLDGTLKQTVYSSGTWNDADYTFTGLSDNTSYSIKVLVVDTSGNSAQITRTVTTQSGRPTNFSWSTNKVSGTDFNVTASEWRSLTSKINEFRAYKGWGTYTFTYVYTGDEMMADYYNQARNAIYSMNTDIPPYRGSGETIYASEIDKLRTSLNLIT